MIGSVRHYLGAVSTSCALAGFGATALAAPAQAVPLDFSHCDNAALSQPFTPWADSNYYKLAPGGDFEGSLGGWSLSGGAQQVSGSESFGVTGAVGSSSLSLSDGSQASSPQSCVDAAYPDFRLFTRTDTPGTRIKVSVVYNAGLGDVTIPVGEVIPTSRWEPTLPLATGSAIPGALNGGTANVALRFSASGGSAQIDDVFIDPSGRCC